MASLTVHDIDDSLVRKLHRRAAGQGRSVEEELQAILQEALRDQTTEDGDRSQLVAELQQFRARQVGRGSDKSAGALLAETRAARMRTRTPVEDNGPIAGEANGSADQNSAPGAALQEGKRSHRRVVAENRDEILRIAAKYGTRNVRLFGSVARDEDDADSDIDLLVVLEPGRSLFDLGGVQYELQALLGCRVDVVTENGLKPRLRDRVLSEAVAL